MTTALPPGWPRPVPPPGAPGWQHRAVGWLLDSCPPDYRGYPVLTRHPPVLAWLAAQHVAAQVEAQRRATASARADLREHVTPEALEEVLATLDEEQARLLATHRAVGLVAAALRGERYVPRL